MLLNDGRLLVITEDTVRNGWLAVYSVGQILKLRDKKYQFTGDAKTDFNDAYDAGLVEISEMEWKRVQRWIDAGRMITVEYTQSGKYRWGFVTRNQLKKREYIHGEEIRSVGYLSEEDFEWLKIWSEAMTYVSAKAAEVEIEKTKPKKPKKRKKRKRKERKNGYRHWSEEWILE